MRLVLETSKTAFTVTKAAEPKTEFGGTQQKVDKQTKRPGWVVEVLALDSERGEGIRVTVSGDQPKGSQGHPVQFSEMEAISWVNNGRDDVADRASATHGSV